MTDKTEAAVEPVAWKVSHPNQFTELSEQPLTQADKDAGWTETPLYAHPAAQPIGDVPIMQATVAEWDWAVKHKYDRAALLEIGNGLRNFVNDRVRALSHNPDPQPQPVNERAAIVAWLRGQSDAATGKAMQAVINSSAERDHIAGAVAIKRAANAIESGAHLPATEGEG